ncbi:MAG: 6-phosphogluconolactonase [Candidatus Nanopelagicales bacterium]
MNRAVQVRPTAVAAAGAAAELLAARARVAVASRGRFTLAVSGGRSPWLMLAALESVGMPWERTTIYQVDERIGTADDPLRNLHGLRQSLPPDGPVAVIPMPVESADLHAACLGYASCLPERLDLIHLGLGPDGHTASLIPGDPVLEVRDADIALTGVYQGRHRMTMTYPRLAHAAAILWLVTGADKVTALQQLLTGDPAIPASAIDNEEQFVFCDEQACPTIP